MTSVQAQHHSIELCSAGVMGTISLEMDFFAVATTGKEA
ncbi:hypothetical protein AB395_00005304 (plasmid) [Sinorhizobium fredii CCBAU 45436]|nr:hypothetical protein AB395_00005304 [Sinorhizobium fredii CCBAU 45436]